MIENKEKNEKEIATEDIDLYQTHVNSFKNAIHEKGLDKALKQYGFIIFHSLEPEEKFNAMLEYGFSPVNALDFYNLGSLDIEKEDFSSAKENLLRALKEDSELTDATYNLALCYEKLGNKKNAIAMWNEYLEKIDSEEEKNDVESHLSELGQ